MSRMQRHFTALLALGAVAFLLAALSVADMFYPRPYDGVILEADVPGSTVVREVVPGSGAHQAGIRQGDVIVGIDRTFHPDLSGPCPAVAQPPHHRRIRPLYVPAPAATSKNDRGRARTAPDRRHLIPLCRAAGFPLLRRRHLCRQPPAAAARGAGLLHHVQPFHALPGVPPSARLLFLGRHLRTHDGDHCSAVPAGGVSPLFPDLSASGLGVAARPHR